MTLPRKLAFRDKFVYRLVQEIADSCAGDEIVFPDNATPIKFVVEMNLLEATKLLSALMTGADLSYPDEAHEVVWIWLRQLECPVSLCDELIECLTPLFDALREQVNQDAIFRQYGTDYPTGVPLPPGVASADLAPGTNPACDFDILWSQSEQLVDYANQTIEDYLEEFELATNSIEFVDVLTSLPVIDEMGADAVAGYVNIIQDGLSENYVGQYDIAYRNALACEIFCAAQLNNCEISIDLVYDILLERVEAYFSNTAGTISTILNLLSYLVDQSIDGAIVVDTMMLLLFGSAKLANFFFLDVGTIPVSTVLQLAVNDANNDWQTLCTTCFVAQNVGIFDECDGGVVEAVEFESGVPFSISAYQSGENSWNIALRLPPGNWSVALNSITGTITAPADTTNTAYAWIDPSTGFQNVLWNAPASPEDFGTHDTTRGVFSAWCASQDWNAVLGNAAPFSANFTVTAL